MQGALVLRADGTSGKVVAVRTEDLVVEFSDGSRLVLPPEKLRLQDDGTYRFSADTAEREEVVIPVVAEELSVVTERIARSKVRVHKRVETREEVVNTPG